MPFQRRRRLLVFSEDEQRMLERLCKSRTEQKRRTVRAAILLDSVAGLSDQAIARAHRVNRNTVILCIQKCLRFGVQAALGECRVRANRVGFRMRRCLGSELRLSETPGVRLCPRVMDVRSADRTPTPAGPVGGVPGTGAGEPLQAA